MSRSNSKRFFDEQLTQSKVKAEIVAKYFWAWGKNAVKNYSLKRRDRVMYLDLFCGPGEYGDGNRSTPLLVMDKIMPVPEFRQWVQVVFNDSNPGYVARLQSLVESIPEIESLSYPPVFSVEKVGPHFADRFNVRTCPTFTFLDPLGYKALSRELIASTIKNYHCDGMFFFNYAWVNRSLSSQVKLKSVFSLFGEERAISLASQITGMSPKIRESRIIDEFTVTLQEVGVEHPLFFRIRHRSRNETSHFLVFAANHGLAHHMMKGIMAGFSTGYNQGVPDYSFDPSIRPLDTPVRQLGLGSLLPEFDEVFAFETIGQLDELRNDLLQRFAGMTMTVGEIYQEHQYGTPYIERNYKDVLLTLEAEKLIRVNPPAHERPKRDGRATLSDTREVTFGSA